MSGEIIIPAKELVTETIGLYGGSFSPPHVAHVLAAAWALATGEISAVWIIPTGGHPFGKHLLPFTDRLALCRLAFAPLGDRFHVLDIEHESKVHYSVETVHRLSEEYPGRRWRWIMGSDTMQDAPRWRGFEELMNLAPPLVIPRQNHHADPATSQAPYFYLPDLSSTLIRELLARGEDPAALGLISREVMAYIVQHDLYQPNP